MRLADFLVHEAGFDEYLKRIWDLDIAHLFCKFDIHSLANLQLFRIFGSDARLSTEYARPKALREEAATKLAKHMALLEEAKEAYFKAISLGKAPNPFASADWKLMYGFVTWMLTGLAVLDEARYYAREAEKDLRNHLRKAPDDIPALRKLGLCIAIYQNNHSVRHQRLAAVEARIREAEARHALGGRPPHGLAVPEAPDSPYPDNWDDIRERVKARDRHRCAQCGAVDVELHVHHIVPLSQGGANELDNLVTLCDICHKEQHSA